MKKSEFHVFKRNTSASATNKGFFFQYLVTLKLWITKSSDSDFEIYCENEDDIMSLDHLTQERSFTQIKCYSKNFSLNDIEIKESLLNFLHLHLKYGQGFKGEFIFYTNSDFKPNAGKSLKKWHKNQCEGVYEVAEFADEVRDIILLHIDQKEKDYSEVHGPISQNAKTSIEAITNFVKDSSFIEFLEKIRWQFSQNKDDSIKELQNEITSLLKPLDYNKNIDVNVFMAYLVYHIMENSSQPEPNNRILNSTLFSKLIKDTNNQTLLVQTLESELLKSFRQLIDLPNEIHAIKEKLDKSIELIERKTAHSGKSNLQLFYDNLYAWFEAVGYKIGYINSQNNDCFYFDIAIIERRSTTKVLIYGITRPITVIEIEQAKNLKDSFDLDEAWVVSTSQPTPAAIKLTEDRNSGTFCYNFDELLEETIDFSNYFSWVENEISARKIDSRFIQIGAKKGEFDPISKKVTASSIYGDAEGGLEGYVDIWLNDNQKEHISLLGEFGSGKTWFTLHYTWKQIIKYKEAKAKRMPRPRIPILVFLRDFSKALQVELLISDFFFRKHNIEIKGTFSAFHQLNEMGKILLVFDGFDEMADKIDKQKMIDNFWELASVVKGDSKAILTCRNEHFSSINESRNLFSAQFKNSTRKNDEDSPKFEIVELLKFDNNQVRELLSHHATPEAIDIIFKNNDIVDLLSRPVMIELILDAIGEIHKEREINLTKIYFYATKRKMERDIDQERTFTSIADKSFFMSELAWEMLSNDKLTINYKEFPDIIYRYFNLNVEEKELDYWRYDMRGQSLLIIDNEEGNYKPAHKSLVEFFVAYKFALELGILKTDFYLQNKISDDTTLRQGKTLPELKLTFGQHPIRSKKLYIVYDFLIDLIDLSLDATLWKYFDEAYQNVEENQVILNNLLALLSLTDTDFRSKNLSHLELEDITWTGFDLTSTSFEKTKFDRCRITNCILQDVNFSDCIFEYEHGIPALLDINGRNKFDFATENSIISVGRLGLQIDNFENQKLSNFFSLGNRDDFFIDLVVVEERNLICALTYDKMYFISNEDYLVKAVKPFSAQYDSRMVVDADNIRMAIISNSEPNSLIEIWNLSSFESYQIKLNLGDLFCCVFCNRSNSLYVAGRRGEISLISLETQSVKTVKTSKELFSPEMHFNSSTYIYSLSLSSDDNQLIIGSTIQSMLILNTNDYTIRREIKFKENEYCTRVQLSRNDKYLAIALTGNILIYDTKDYSICFEHYGFDSNFRFSKDSRFFAYGKDYDETSLIILDLSSLKKISEINKNIDCTKLNIKNLIAPLMHIRRYSLRGSKNWLSKEELMALDDAKLKLLTKWITREDEVLAKEEVIKRIMEYISYKR